MKKNHNDDFRLFQLNDIVSNACKFSLTPEKIVFFRKNCDFCLAIDRSVTECACRELNP